MRYSDAFLLALSLTLKWEGIYSNDPDDPGGETWKGISRGNFPDWEGWKVIDQLKDPKTGRLEVKAALNHKGLESMVQFFYHETFWVPLRGEEIKPPIACQLFDQAVNQGIGQAVRGFQESLNLLNRGGIDYPDIFVDGKMGPKTMDSFAGYMNTARLNGRSIETCEKVLLKVMKAMQAERYIKICRANPTMEKFFFGWMKTRL